MSSSALAVRDPARRTGVATLNLPGWLGTMSPHTARAYDADLRQFEAWLAARDLDGGNVRPGVTTQWLADLASGKDARLVKVSPDRRLQAIGAPLSPATQARKLAAVRSFYAYARAEGQTTIDPTPPRSSTPKVHLDPTRGAIDPGPAARVWASTAGRPRLRALVATMLFSGLRVSEAISLQVADVQEQAGAKVLRITRKGSRPGTAVLPPDSVLAIDQWLAVRGTQPGPLFCTASGAPIAQSAVYKEVRRLGDRAGVPGLHPHTLRHTFATVAADDPKVRDRDIQDALGHASMNTTQRYTRGRDIIRNSPVYAVAAAILSAAPRQDRGRECTCRLDNAGTAFEQRTLDRACPIHGDARTVAGR